MGRVGSGGARSTVERTREPKYRQGGAVREMDDAIGPDPRLYLLIWLANATASALVELQVGLMRASNSPCACERHGDAARARNWHAHSMHASATRRATHAAGPSTTRHRRLLRFVQRAAHCGQCGGLAHPGHSRPLRRGKLRRLGAACFPERDRSRARRDSAYRPTEPVTVRPAIGLWWKHSFCPN